LLEELGEGLGELGVDGLNERGDLRDRNSVLVSALFNVERGRDGRERSETHLPRLTLTRRLQPVRKVALRVLNVLHRVLPRLLTRAKLGERRLVTGVLRVDDVELFGFGGGGGEVFGERERKDEELEKGFEDGRPADGDKGMQESRVEGRMEGMRGEKGREERSAQVPPRQMRA
jgi:hypothetical protein